MKRQLVTALVVLSLIMGFASPVLAKPGKAIPPVLYCEVVGPALVCSPLAP